MKKGTKKIEEKEAIVINMEGMEVGRGTIKEFGTI